MRFDAIQRSTLRTGGASLIVSVTSSTSASTPSASQTTRMRSPGLAWSSARASSSPACAQPVRPTLAASVSAICSGLSPSGLGEHGHRARVGAVEDDGRQRRRLDAGGLQRAFAVSMIAGAIVSAVKRSSHCRAKRSSGRRHTSRISIVDDARPSTRAIASLSGPVTNAAAASPPWLSRALPGAPVTRSLAQTSARLPAVARSRPSSSAARPMRDEPLSATELTASGRSSAAWIVARVELLGVGGAERGEQQRVERHAAAHGVARRLDGHRHRVLVEARHRALALSRPDRRPREAEVGHVAAVPHDTCHESIDLQSESDAPLCGRAGIT